MSDTRTVAHNTISQVVARIVALIASFLVIPVLTRYLGPNLYGVYSLVLVLNSFLITLSDLGIQTIATREASQDIERADFYAAQAVLLRVLSSIVLASLAVIVIALTGYQDIVKVGFAIAASSVIFNGVQAGLTVFLQARLKVYLASIADMVGRVASTAFILFVILLATKLALAKVNGLYLIFTSVGIGTLVAALITLLLSLRTRLFQVRFDWILAKRILRDSLPLWIVAIVSLLNYRVDTILLSFLKSSYEVGIYNLSYKLLDITLAFPTFFMASVFPLLSRKQEDPEEFRRFSHRAFEAMAFGAVPIGLGIFSIAPQIVNVLGGSSFSESIIPLRFLSLAGIFSYMSQLMLYMLVIKNKQKILLIVTSIVTTINVILNLLLIPAHSYDGAAFVTLVSEVLMFTLLFISVTKVHNLQFSSKIPFRIILAGLLMLVAVELTPSTNIIILVPLAVIVYIASSYLLKAFDPQTVREIASRGS